MTDKSNCENWCQEAYKKYLMREELHMLVLEKNTNSLVGVVGLYNIDWDLRIFYVGYWGVSNFSGKGYITEAVKNLVKYAIDNLKASRICITTDDRNENSWRLAERASFSLEEILHNDQLDMNKKLRNTRVYAIWKNRQF